MVYRWIAIALCTVLFGANVYRAATQSLTIDESFTYQLYLAKNLRAILTDYDANNHVLYTLLAKLTVALFGKSELAIRLPSVLAGLLYFLAVYQLCRLLFRDGWLFLLAVAALTLNPFVLDFLSAARGYGLALALFLLGLWLLLTDRLPRAGTSFGLAVAANLSLVFPIAALIAVYWAQRLKQTWKLVDSLMIPAVVSAFIVLAIPVMHMKPGSFYVGSQSLWTGLQTVVLSSVPYYMAPLAPVMAIIALLLCRHWLGAAFLLTIAMVTMAHFAAHLGYPELRTGLYLIPFFTLVYLLGIKDRQWFWSIPMVVLVALYALQWNVSYYTEWKFDSSTKKIAQMLRDRQPRRVGASWELEPSLNYYRERYRIASLEPLTRVSPDGDYDCYVLLPSDYAVISKRRLKEVYRDPVSEAVLAVP